MELKDYTTEELKAELKRRTYLAKKEEFLKNVNFGRYPKYEITDIREGKPDKDTTATVLTENDKMYLAKYEDGKWQQAHFTSTKFGECQQIYYTDIDDNIIYWCCRTEKR